MKIIHILFLSLLIVLVGCTNEVPDVFTSSPAERVNNALVTNADTLQSAVNGWAMEYFATEKSAGYTLLVKFDKSGKATIAGKNDLTKNILLSDTSMYQLIADNGPVLTFNSYNKVLHAFSNPVNPDGYGLEGDYEFIVMKATANQIILKGKKRGTTILMNKLPEDITWVKYFADLDAMNTLLFGSNAPNLSLSIVDKYIFSKGASHIFNILKDGADSKTSNEAPFVITPTGIRFLKIQELDGKSFQTLTLNAEKTALVSNENAELKLVGPVNILTTYLDKSIHSWVFDTTLMSPKVKSVYSKMVLSAKKVYYGGKQPNVTVQAVVLSLSYSEKLKKYVLTLSIQKKSTQIVGGLYFTGITSNNDFLMNFEDSGDSFGLKFYDDSKNNPNMTVVGFKEMQAIFSSKFILSTNAIINPKSIKFTQINDADTWFTLNRN